MRGFSKKIRLLGLFLPVLLLMFLTVPVSAFEASAATVSEKASVKKGLVKENGKYCYYDAKGNKVKNKWKKVDGERYYFWSDGYAVRSCVSLDGKAYVFNPQGQLLHPKKTGFYKNGKNTFYVKTNGQAYTGWFTVSGKLYRADFKGRLYKNRTYQGVVFTDTGSVKPNTASKLKLKTMEIAGSITNSKMSKPEKLKACWRYVVNSGKFRYKDMSPNIGKKGWQKEFAYNMLVSRAGSCSSFACAFAALAAEVGYTPYVIYGRVPGSRDGAPDGMTRHCWVKIDGKHYDPEGTWAGWAGYVYGSTYFPTRHTITQVVNFKE